MKVMVVMLQLHEWMAIFTSPALICVWISLLEHYHRHPHQVEMEIVMPIEYTLKQVHDISLELQIKVWGDRGCMLCP